MRLTVPSTRRRLLYSAAVVSFFAAGQASAEEAETIAAETVSEIEYAGADIVVSGSIVQAQEDSIEAKRKAVNVTDIASADAAARFPDQNAAAALARLPAVAVQRDQGQERYIQVRGAPNRWTSVSIDGVPMIGVDEGGESRAFRFDAIPAVMLSEMAINKSLTSDLQADSVVATINLKTYSPLDRTGFHVDGDVGYGFMDLGDGEQRQGSLRASWSNESFGVVVGGSHYRRKQVTDNREASYDSETMDPTSFSVRNYKLERWNNGLFGGLEWSPDAGQRVFAKFIYSEFSDDEQRNQYDFGVSGNDVVSMRGSFNYGEYRNRNYIGTIGGDYDDLDGFTASFKLNYTRTENTTDLPLIMSSASALPEMTVDYSNPEFPIFTVESGTFEQAGLSTTSAILLPLIQETTSDSYTLKGDISKEAGDLTLFAGMLFADRDIQGNTMSQSSYVPLAYGMAIGQPFDINSYITDRPWETNFPSGLALNYADNKAMTGDAMDLLDGLAAAGLWDPSSAIAPTTLYGQKERTLAGYGMAQYASGPLTVIGGLRIEKYSMENTGQLQSVATDGSTVFTPQTYDFDKTDFFPSLNLKFEASDDVVLRLAGQRGVSRPAYGAIRVGASINDTATPGTISGGNPALKPEYTWGADASVEYYLPGNGLLSVAGFYRWVDNVFYSSAEFVTSDFYDSDGFDRTGYLLGGTYNGESGTLYGLEFNALKQFDFLPGPLDGLGFQGNLTLLDGDFDTPTESGLPFQGMSDTIANASLFYEKYGISARVSYQWRSDWTDTLGGMGAGENRKGYENLDVSLRYAVTDAFTLYADLANLTDEKYIAYSDTMAHPTEVEQIGSRYMFGIRFSF
ncbi:TonB-dependent receptor [Croceicoccus sp. Ery15]|uniref:TonB-dependent receptor n=1 Tax=Croceicoccus sp. Ery15 TaxID=1703338 RepID=UPI001E29C2F1|nr:TonB-dependent receptor [Croceicoccus sp. Ery15]